MLRKKEKELKPEKKENSKIFFLLFIFLITNSHITKAQNNEILNNLDNIEEKVFHEKFTKSLQEERINKLEEFLFDTKYPNETIESRIKKINSALEPKEAQIKKPRESPDQKIEPQPEAENPEKEESKVIYDESYNVGVLGAVSQIEKRLFDRVFNNLPFQARIQGLEERLLTRSEILNNRKKPLIERVTVLVQRANLPMPKENSPIVYPSIKKLENNQYKSGSKNYTIDPNTGYLINEQTGDIVRDNYGNPITVRVPQPLQQQQLPSQNYGLMFPQNQYNPNFPNTNPLLKQPGFPGALPLDLFGAQDNGTEPEY